MKATKNGTNRQARPKTTGAKGAAAKTANDNKANIAGPKNSRHRTVQSSAKTGSFSAAEARKAIRRYLKGD